MYILAQAWLKTLTNMTQTQTLTQLLNLLIAYPYPFIVMPLLPFYNPLVMHLSAHVPTIDMYILSIMCILRIMINLWYIFIGKPNYALYISIGKEKLFRTGKFAFTGYSQWYLWTRNIFYCLKTEAHEKQSSMWQLWECFSSKNLYFL